MARPQAFERELKVAGAGFEPDALRKLLADTARQALADAIADGSAPPSFVRYVNGREGASEDSVELPGPILYEFNWLAEIAEYALAFCQERSPVRSGRFKSSWFAMVNGRAMTEFDQIPAGAELIITNDQPYARRIEVGKTKAGRPFVIQVPPGIVQDARKAVMNRFGNVVKVEIKFISLAGAYVLKGRSVRKGRSDKDRKAGREVTYPALVINQIF